MGCSRCGVFRIGDVEDGVCLGCKIFRIWDVGGIACLGFGMLGMVTLGIWDVLRYGVARMWNPWDAEFLTLIFCFKNCTPKLMEKK